MERDVCTRGGAAMADEMRARVGFSQCVTRSNQDRHVTAKDSRSKKAVC